MNQTEVPSEDVICIGNYVIIQRQGYFKLHHLSQKCDLMLGKDKIDLSAIIGKKFWTMFKMITKRCGKREFDLEVCTKCESIPEEVFKKVSGTDNRNISDDGKSQLLTTEDIVGLRSSGLSAQNIVGKLIQNSTTFKAKTEYSQEKYLKKKEKKYFEYIVVRKPSLRLLADIFYNKDQLKILGLRYDTLTQILSLANVQHNGTYLLFESGTQALVGASVLSCLSNQGTLINLTLGNQPAKHAILGLNFDAVKLSRLLNVKIVDFFEELKFCKNNEKIGRIENEEIQTLPNKELKTSLEDDSKKRKLSTTDSFVNKKPKWAEEFETATCILKENLADGIIIASKEYPLNIFEKFINFLKPSRQIVIYSLYREPLIELFVVMKKRKDLIAIHLFENWLRTFQILPERTHPDVTMTANGGHILIATKVCQ